MRIIGLAIMMFIMMHGCSKKYDDKCKDAEYISVEKLRADYPRISAAREIEKAAKIYNYQDGEILLVNERNKGIHVINNRVKETPVRVSFIEIPGNVDMAVKDGYLYVDSFTDLLVMDIRNINDVKTIYRKEKIFPYDAMQAVASLKEDGECYRYDTSKKDVFVIGFR